jgi:hypothetical protein
MQKDLRREASGSNELGTGSYRVIRSLDVISLYIAVILPRVGMNI